MNIRQKLSTHPNRNRHRKRGHFCVATFFAIRAFSIVFSAPQVAPAQLLMAHYDIYAVDTVSKSTIPLLTGKKYEFHCEGTYSFWRNAQNDSVGLVDAAYYVTIPPGETGVSFFPTTITNGFLLNDQPIAGRVQPLGYQSSHHYVVPVTGVGNPASLFIDDRPPFSVDRHADNTGMIRVSLYNVSPEIFLASDTLFNFGDVELQSFRDTTITIANIGDGPLNVGALTITGADSQHFSITTPTSFLLAPGMQQIVGLRFAPQSIFQKNAALHILNNDSDTPDIAIALTGVGVTTMTAGFQQYHDSPPHSITIPAELFQHLPGSNTTSFSFSFDYSPSVLRLLDVSNAGTRSDGWILTHTSPHPGNVQVQGQGSAPLTGSGILVNFHFEVVYGDTLQSPLRISSLRFNQGNPRGQEISGLFVVDTVCDFSRKRITILDAAQLKQNHPNPFGAASPSRSASTMIGIVLPQTAYIRLEIFSVSGEWIQTIADGSYSAGEFNFAVDGSELQSGSYLYRLTVNGEAMTKRMVVVR